VLEQGVTTWTGAVKGDQVHLTVLDERDRAPGQRLGGAVAQWVSEGGTFAASTAKVRRVTVGRDKLLTIIYTGEELFEDTGVLEQHVTATVTAEQQCRRDTAILTGSGVGEPLGILNSGALVTVAADAGQTAGSITMANISNAVRRLLPWCIPRASIICHPDAYGALLQVAGSAYSAPTAEAPYGRLWAFPLIPCEYCPPLGTVGDVVVADLTDYLLVVKSEQRLDYSPDVRFLNGEGVFRLSQRIGGQPLTRSATTPFGGGAARSPYVAVATRA
jgi:HK97 family phage major capsid protein